MTKLRYMLCITLTITGGKVQIQQVLCGWLSLQMSVLEGRAVQVYIHNSQKDACIESYLSLKLSLICIRWKQEMRGEFLGNEVSVH